MRAENLCEFFRTILTCHRAFHKESEHVFDAQSLLIECGYEDWTQSKELLELMEHHYSNYIARAIQRLGTDQIDAEVEKEADGITSLVCGFRVGKILKMTLEQHFKGKYKILDTKAPGRFGGKTQYKWIY
jgi:hypothetical protein